MGVAINTGDTVGAKYSSGLITPAQASMVGLFIMLPDSTAALPVSAIAKNWAPGGVDAAIVGAPVLDGAGFGATLKSGSNYLQTGIYETDNMTMFAIPKIGGAGANSGWPISNYPSPRSLTDTTSVIGTGLQMSNSAGSQVLTGFFSKYSGSPGGASGLIGPSGETIASPSGARAIALRDAETAGTVTFNDLTSGVKNSATRSSGVRDKGSAPMRLGSSYSADGQDPIEYYMFALWSTSLSDSDLASFYTWAKAFCARRGVAI